MAETQNIFEGSGSSSGTSAGWGAGIGGLIGAAIGNGNLFGNNNTNAVTPDQLQTTVNNLQNQMSTEAVQAHLGRVQSQIATSSADTNIALGTAINGVKDAVISSNAQTQLTLCTLGHNLQAGLADVNKTILLQAAAVREQSLTQALDAERARATELRIALSEHKNASGHQTTQVLLNQVLNAGGSAGNP